MGARRPYATELTLTARSTSLDPFLRALQPVAARGALLVASGEVRLHGPLLTPGRDPGGGDRSRPAVPAARVPVRAREPVRLTARRRPARARRLPPRRRGDRPRRHRGRRRSSARARSPCPLRGQADLRALSLLTRRLRGTGGGPSRRRRLRHPGGSPRSRARSTSTARGCGCAASRTASRACRAACASRRAAAELEGVSGTLAGGRLTDRRPGRLRRAGGSPRTTSAPRGRGLALRYPEGLRSLVDARPAPLRRRDEAVDHGHGRRAPGALHEAVRRRVGDARHPPKASPRRPRRRARRGRAARPARPRAGHAAHRQQPRDPHRARRPRPPGHDAGPGRDRARGDRARADCTSRDARTSSSGASSTSSTPSGSTRSSTSRRRPASTPTG